MKNTNAYKLLLLIFMSTLIILSLPHSTQAVPAAPIEHTLYQPDGFSFKARQWGDEDVHGWETEDGYSIVFNDRLGSWTYAIHDLTGNLTSSQQRVNLDPLPPDLAKNLRPTARALALIPKKRHTKEIERASGQYVVPPYGTGNIPVILVNFSDTTANYESTDFNALLFGTGNYSMKDYYEEVSYGAFSISAGPDGIAGWYRAINNHDYYGENDSKGNDKWPGDLVYEAVKAADEAGFNFAPYDQDGDGYVDVVAIVHQGTGEEASHIATDIWSHRWDLNSACFFGNSPQYGFGSHYCEYITNDLGTDGNPVRVNDYIIQPELLGSDISTMGVFAHEYGHSFGLPDLYDTDGSSNGIGYWSLMAGGSWNKISRNGDCPAHMDAWCKYSLGWVSPIQVTGTLSNAPVNQAATDPDVYQLLSGSPSTGGEYFLIENRQKAGFDQGLPGAGLLIWHIDESQQNNNNECYPSLLFNCNFFRHYHVALEQADNLWELEKKVNKGNSGDPYPGSTNNRSFTATSSPNSNLYSGSPSNVSITNISDSGPTMTATLSTSGTSPECSSWGDVIAKYNAYVSGTAVWSEVITCYNQYAKP